MGVYSEEAQEACNKMVRNARLDHTAKISRTNVMQNQVHYLLQRSDPVVTSISFKKQKYVNDRALEPSVLELILED